MMHSATRVVISNPARSSSVQADVTNGGFDPVSLTALAGDSLRIDVMEGGSSPAASYRAGVPRDAAPILVRTDPVRSQPGVPIGDTLTIVFSEPMDSASLAEATTLAGNGLAVPSTLRLLNDRTVAQVIPASPLLESTTYQLQTTLAARDRDGRVITSAVVSSFTTVADIRAPTVVLKMPANAELPAGYPCVRAVATDAGGIATMNWHIWAGPSDGAGSYDAYTQAGAPRSDASYCPDLPSGVGEWSATVTATDQSGNEATPATVSFRLAEPDQATPVTVRSFSMIVFTDQGDQQLYAAPQLVVADAPGGNGFEIIGIEFQPVAQVSSPFLKFVARNLEVPAGGETELFAPLYGDYAIAIGLSSAPPSGTVAAAYLTWKDGGGQFHKSALSAEFVAGGPPPYGGGYGHWGFMGSVYFNYEPSALRRGEAIKVGAPARPRAMRARATP